MTDFRTRVSELAQDLLVSGSKVFEGSYEEQEVFEAYREALRNGGVSKLGLLADSALKACDQKKAPSELVFEMFADAVDASTVPECNTLVWGELESRAVQLRKLTLSSQQRPKLALLRVANELLRRLSQTQDPILCGRVLMLLATALPLSDSSGFNIGGKYNFENETVIETTAQFTESGSAQKDYTSYERFWKLQRYFSGPFVLSYLTDFKSCLETTFAMFESKPLLSVDGDKDDNDFFPKYLTAGRLLSLQWADPKLRRYVLVQVLFFLRQVFLFAEQAGNADLIQVVGVWRVRAIKLLNQIPPKGKAFTESIIAAIDREAVWESWKKEKCPVIEQQGLTGAVTAQGKSERFIKAQLEQQSRSKVTPPKWTTVKTEANAWKDALRDNDEEEEEYDEESEPRDPLELFSFRMLDSLQPGYDYELYDPRKDFVYCWQGLRLCRQRRFDLFEASGGNSFERVVRLMNNMPLPANPEEKSPGVNEENVANEPSVKEANSSTSDADVKMIVSGVTPAETDSVKIIEDLDVTKPTDQTIANGTPPPATTSMVAEQVVEPDQSANVNDADLPIGNATIVVMDPSAPIVDNERDTADDIGLSEPEHKRQKLDETLNDQAL